MPAPRAPAAFRRRSSRARQNGQPSKWRSSRGDKSHRPTWERQNEHVMKWTPKRVIVLAAVGLIAWGASSATGHERDSTATPRVGSGTLSDAAGPTPDPGSAKPPADAPPRLRANDSSAYAKHV